MATFYIQLQDKLLQISGELTAENISKALGYVPVSPNVTNELSQRVDNITFDSLKDNPFLQDGSGELNIVDDVGNIIAKIDAEGIHSIDFITGEHRLSDKTDKTYVDEAIKNVKVDLTGYATEEYVNNIDFYNINNNPIVNNGDGKLLFVDENGYIGLQLEENGLYVKDVIADGHTLSQKADKSDIPSLDGYATESYVNTNLQNYATKDEIPTKVSDLENDSNYLTNHQDISHLATKEEVSNIDFYNINNNPIVNNGDGKLLFVDENGYIGLQLEEDGLYVKDVIADGHTLSQKADKSELSNYATKDEVSELVDMSVVTELQGKVNKLIDTDTDKSVRDIAVDVLTETLVSETATEAYDTLAEMSDWIKSHPEDASAMNTAIQTNATDIQSNATAISNLDAAYKEADIKVLTDAQEYTDNINFYTIKDNPIVDNNDGNLTFVDESGNIGLQFSNNAILANDVITPEHTLSEKADRSELPTKVSQLENDYNYISTVDTSETLDDVETNTYVKYVVQTLTEEQKAQVKQNLGISDEIDLSSLSTVATTGSYNDLTDKPEVNFINPENDEIPITITPSRITFNNSEEEYPLKRHNADGSCEFSWNSDGLKLKVSGTIEEVYNITTNGTGTKSLFNDGKYKEVYTKSEIDNKLGDINTMLESIIRGE